MSTSETFLWHDYETFGADPFFDRPAQFAAVRTNLELEPVEDPINWFCSPADDVLPHPDACLITGITPQAALRNGVCEAEFATRIHVEMTRPGTCSAGYNSLRFDDLFTRNLFYRNLRDPYQREYQNGNSRWDLIDLARMCYALRPEGMKWAFHDMDPSPAEPSFRLADLARENHIEHTGAHEALSDVHATIGLARALRKAQPRLWDWALQLRSSEFVMNLLDPANPRPVIHTSARIPALRGCTTLELPLAVLPDRPKTVIAFDLMADPEVLIAETAEAIADRVFTATADLPEGIARLPLKQIHSNHVPMIAPQSSLHGVDLARIRLDPDRCMATAREILRHLPDVRRKVLAVYSRPESGEETPYGDDPDQMLYSGGFFSRHDRNLMNKILQLPPAALASHAWTFQDSRLPLLLFRYRARNFPETLSPGELEAWDRDRTRRLVCPRDPRQLSYGNFLELIARLRREHSSEARVQQLLDQLLAWGVDSGLERLWRDQEASR